MYDNVDTFKFDNNFNNWISPKVLAKFARNPRKAWQRAYGFPYTTGKKNTTDKKRTKITQQGCTGTAETSTLAMRHLAGGDVLNWYIVILIFSCPASSIHDLGQSVPDWVPL